MNDRLHAVNEDLQVLADAYRLGQIGREDYRQRRRHVLSTLNASPESDTQRKPIRVSSSDTTRTRPSGAAATGSTMPSGVPSAAAPAPPATRSLMRYWLLFAVACGAIAVVVYLLLRSPDGVARGDAVPALEKRAAAGVEAAFLAAKRDADHGSRLAD